MMVVSQNTFFAFMTMACPSQLPTIAHTAEALKSLLFLDVRIIELVFGQLLICRCIGFLTEEGQSVDVVCG